MIKQVLRLGAVGLIVAFLWLSSENASEHGRTSAVMLTPTSPTCSAEVMSADRSPLRIRLRSDGTIQIGDVVKQRKEALNTFLQLRETRAQDQAVWIEVDNTLTLEQVVSFLGPLESTVSAWKPLLVTSETHLACDSAFSARRQGAA